MGGGHTFQGEASISVILETCYNSILLSTDKHHALAFSLITDAFRLISTIFYCAFYLCYVSYDIYHIFFSYFVFKYSDQKLNELSQSEAIM